MKSLQELRLERLRSYLADECGGNKSELVRRSKKKQSYISDLLRGKKSFGEKAARGLEAQLHIPSGWFDQSAVKAATVAESATKYADLTIPERIALRVEQMDEGVQFAILNMIEAVNGQAIERRRGAKRKATSTQS